MEIRSAHFEDLAQVLNILNTVSQALKEKGINQWNDPWRAEQIVGEIENGQAFVLLNEKDTIGTFFIREVGRISEWVVEPHSLYLNKIAILPDYQGKNIGSQIIEFALSFSRNLRKEIYLDCWAGNEKLKTFYSTHGFKYVRDVPEDNYYISVFQGK